jgi:branched-subunit amino acid aminotransferase/4-amino-4-deoxychorismate lyase
VRVAFARKGRDAPAVSITRRPIPPVPRQFRVAVAAVPRTEAPDVRSHKQLDRSWVERALVAGVDETLLFDVEHGLLEGIRSNLFLCMGRQLVTPPVAFGLVPGVVRAEWVARAAEFGFDLVERAIGPGDLKRCDAMVLTGSGVGVVTVSECDGRAVGTVAGRERLRRVRTRLLAGG